MRVHRIFTQTYSHKMPQKLTTTACFIQEEPSDSRQLRKHVSCFYMLIKLQPQVR